MSEDSVVPWSDQPVPGIDGSMLDPRAIDHFRRKVSEAGMPDERNICAPVPELLMELGLIVNGDVTRAGILLFHPRPEDVIAGSFTELSSLLHSDVLFREVIGGPLVRRFDRIMDVLWAKYLSKLITYDGWTRIENDPFPRESMEECIINALVHSDYSSSDPVQIRVWPERMVVLDSGGIPDGWTEKDLLSIHPSVPVNPRIADVFHLMGYSENRGSGIERMLGGYKRYPGRDVAIRADRDSFQVAMDAIITLEDVRDQLFMYRGDHA